MAVNLERARSFVAAHGTPVERARLARLLGNSPEPPTVLLGLQHADGGFPYDWEAGAPVSLQHTATTLQWLRDLELTNEPAATRAATLLLKAQKGRGLWRESDELRRYDLPLWMEPDDSAADVYTTALCANALVPYPQASLVLDRAQAWLQTQQARDGLLQGFKLHASVLAIPVFPETVSTESRATRRLVAGLGGSLGPDWPASTMVLLLRHMLDAGYGLRTEVVARAWTMLQPAQMEDGSFANEDENIGSAAVTLDVLFIAHQLGYEVAER